MQRTNLIIENSQSQRSPTKKGIFINGSRNDAQSPNDKPILMTRRELNDPFGSDEEDDNDNELRKNQRKSPPRELISPPPTIDDVNICVKFFIIAMSFSISFIFLQKIVTRHKQQSEKAKELIEKLRNENGKSFDEDEVRKDVLIINVLKT
jgi:hypothetical protein